MKQTPASTLSAHLLHEASKFFIYPHRKYRTKTNLADQRFMDDRLRRLVEWRKTFAPETVKIDVFAEDDAFGGPVLLDQLYCRERLREIPDVVDRTRKLTLLTLSGISGESFVYLREAANCYILGLPRAAVALARAAMEVPLRRAASKVFGDKAVAAVGLFALIDDLAKRARLLSPDKSNLAHQVRIAADKVLHEQPTTAVEALAIVEAARVVVLELARKAR
jgi:hypothetical protein